jgi:arabinofuranosyltransferase
MSSVSTTIISRHRRERLFPAMIGVVGVAIAFFVWPYRLRFPFDDVFITFRYAEHLASGNGFVWNIGGAHTEGFTNFLFVLLLAAARLVTGHLLAAAQIMGIVSTIVTGIFIYHIGSKARGPAVGVLAAALYLLTPLTWINALSGMETSIFVMFIAIAVDCAIRGRLFRAFGAAFFATLTRPEGALIGIILLVVLASMRRQTAEHRTLNGTATAFLFGFFLPLIIYAIWKYLYFGEWLPNSFYVKVLQGSRALLPGLQYVRLFFVSALVLILFTFGIRRWRDRAVLFSVLFVTALLAFYLFVLPLEGLYDRYLWSALAMLCVLAAIGVHDLAQRLHFRSIIVPTIVALAAQIALSMASPRTQQALDAHEEAWDASMDPIVHVLTSLPHFDSLRFAYGDAGYVVYRSGINHIDLFGLNDTRIAHARTRVERASIIRSERPDVMLLPVYYKERPSRFDSIAWVEDAYGLARTSSFDAVASTKAFPYKLVWLLNTNSPYYQDCKETIEHELTDSSFKLQRLPSTR